MKDIKVLYYIGALAFIAAISVFTIWFATRPIPLVLQGEVVAKQVQISPRIVGRVEKVYVDEGQDVKKGDLLTRLDAPSIQAKVNQAEAALRAADAQKTKVFAGARSEEITALLNVYEKATVAEQLTRKTYDRVKQLFDDGVIPAQKLDEAKTAWSASLNDMAAAKAQYEMAKSGARVEDKSTASAIQEQASAAVQEALSFFDDTVLTAPIDASVMTVVVETGELVTPGFPVLTLVDLNEIWVAFNIREDLLKDIRMGTIINVKIPAISDTKEFPVVVKYIANVGDFAVWSATKTSGQFDLKTFEIKAYPKEKIDGLRPGMSAIFYMPNNK